MPSGNSTSSRRYRTPPRKRAWIFRGSALELDSDLAADSGLALVSDLALDADFGGVGNLGFPPSVSSSASLARAPASRFCSRYTCSMRKESKAFDIFWARSKSGQI